MNIVIGSLSKGAGKTSMIIGLGKAKGIKTGYLKPLGDRLIYRKKRLWDYDSAVITNIFGLDEDPEEMSIGFEHAKLKFMFDEAGCMEKLAKMESDISKGKKALFIEGSKDLTNGASVYLDVMNIAKHLKAKLILVADGSNIDAVVDALYFIKRYVKAEGVDFGGVIINKVSDVEDFKATHLEYVKDMGLKVLGVVPYEKSLDSFKVSFLADALFAKVIAGESGLSNSVSKVFVGAMSADAVVCEPWFAKEEGKLVITSGDRSDMIIAALETKSSAILLTNTILPPANIISKAQEMGTPLLSVAVDTFKAAEQIDSLDPLITKGDDTKVEMLKKLVKEHVDVGGIL